MLERWCAVRHPALPPVYRFLEFDDHFLALLPSPPEDAQDLTQIKATRLRGAQLSEIFQALARLGAFLDSEGLVHPGLQLHHIFIDEAGGIRIYGAEGARPSSDSTGESPVNLDVRYTAPELLAGGRAGPLSEIYHYGALLYHFLAGRPYRTRETFPGVNRFHRHLGKTWDTLLGAMLQADPLDRPDWSRLQQQLRVLGSASKQPVWVGGRDTVTLERLETALAETNDGPAAVAVQVYPGRERVGRLLPFTRTAEQKGFLVFHSWVEEEANRTYKLINDFIYLLGEGVLPHLNRPELERDLEPLSELTSDEAAVRHNWHSYLDRLTEALVPAHCRGFVICVEDIQNLDEASLQALCKLVSWICRVPLLLVVTGDSFTHGNFRTLEKKLKFRWSFLHPAPMDDRRLDRILRTPAGDEEDWRPPQRIMSQTNRQEILYFLWLDEMHGHQRAQENFLRRCWAHLDTREQKVLRLLSCTERSLTRVDLERVLKLKQLGPYLKGLARYNFIRRGDGGAYRIIIPAVGAFCRNNMPKSDMLLLSRRLLEDERARALPDPVQVTYLTTRLSPEGPPPNMVRELLSACETAMSVATFQRMQEVYRRTRFEGFRVFHLWMRLLQGKTLKPADSAEYVPFEYTARAARARANGKTRSAFRDYRRLSGIREVTEGVRAFAALQMLELATASDNRREGLWALNRLQQMDLAELDLETRDDWRQRIAFCAVSLGQKNTRVQTPLLESLRAWRSGHYHRGLAPARTAVDQVRNHHDLNWRGRILKHFGNLSFRNNLPEKAMEAYRAALTCFESAGNPIESAHARYNFAYAELLHGSCRLAYQHFQPLFEEAVASGDKTTTCNILNHFMACNWLLNDLEAFDRHAESHDKAARKAKLPEELIRGLVLKLQTALYRDESQVTAWMKELNALAKDVDDSLVRAEVDLALRIGSFAAGKDAAPPSGDYPQITAWRHRLLDHLTGYSGEPFEGLLKQIDNSYFGAMNGQLLAAAIQAGHWPEDQLTPALARVFEKRMRTSGARYAGLLREHFSRLSEASEISGEELERLWRLFADVNPRQPAPDAVMGNVCREMARIWPYERWGAHRAVADGWQRLPARKGSALQPALEEHLQRLRKSDAAGPTTVTLLDEKDQTVVVLILPLSLENREQAFAWFEHRGSDRGEPLIGNKFLLRFHAWLLSLALQGAGARATLTESRHAPGGTGFFGIVGKSPRLTEALEQVRLYGPSSMNIFIWGESGTGKELIARAVHAASPRHQGPFVAVNCSSLAESMVEAELFGHARGAFTGAISDRRGMLEMADGGTLFLDEIADINPKIQSLLLRVIQEGELTRIGENKVRKVDIRLVTATNKDLHAMINSGAFREDLYFRIVNCEINLPALRERFEDLPLLVSWFVDRFQPGRRVFFDRSFFQALREYDWPGNVRELETYIKKLLVHWGSREAMSAAEVLPFLRGTSDRDELPTEEGSLEQLEETYRRRILKKRLEMLGGNRTAAARSLNVSRQTLLRLIRKYDLD